MKCIICGGNSTQIYCSKLCEDNTQIPSVQNPELLDRCYCVDSSWKLYDFKVNEDSICHYLYLPSINKFIVYIQYVIIPCSRITGELNKQLFKTYVGVTHEVFNKHFRTLGEWREDQINSILYGTT